VRIPTPAAGRCGREGRSQPASRHEREGAPKNSAAKASSPSPNYPIRSDHNHRPKRQRDKREKYHHSLKALAIRSRKIHMSAARNSRLRARPSIWMSRACPTVISYYLIGVRIGHGDSAIQHSLWAEHRRGRGEDLARILGPPRKQSEQPVLIYYGSF